MSLHKLFRRGIMFTVKSTEFFIVAAKMKVINRLTDKYVVLSERAKQPCTHCHCYAKI